MDDRTAIPMNVNPEMVSGFVIRQNNLESKNEEIKIAEMEKNMDGENSLPSFR